MKLLSRVKSQKTASTASLHKQLQKTLLELLAIESEHPHEDKVATYIKRRLKRAGVSFVTDGFGNIIANVQGTGEPIMLSTHMDIPESIPNLGYTIEGDIIRSDGNGILGVDPKSGLAVLLEFLCNLPKGDHVPIEAVITRGEEKGLLGARNLDYSLIKAKYGLVLDEDGPVSNIVVQAPSSIHMDVSFVGKAAHPREPELGHNALQAATHAMSKLPWGYTKNQVMWNIGTFQAGTARNTIPGTARFSADMRGYDDVAAQRDAKEIAETLTVTAAEYDVECHIETKVDTKGYKHEPDTPIVARIEQALHGLGISPNLYATFGRSDANIFNAHGINTAAIGSGYYNAHQYTEYASLADLAEIYQFLHAFTAH